MIRVCDLSMPLDYTEKDLRETAAKALNIPLNEILSAPSTCLSPERKRPF